MLHSVCHVSLVSVVSRTAPPPLSLMTCTFLKNLGLLSCRVPHSLDRTESVQVKCFRQEFCTGAVLCSRGSYQTYDADVLCAAGAEFHHLAKVTSTRSLGALSLCIRRGVCGAGPQSPLPGAPSSQVALWGLAAQGCLWDLKLWSGRDI